MTPEQERRLIDAVSSAFVGKKFDALSITVRAEDNTALAEAIEAVIPNCRYRSRWRRGRFKYRLLYRALQPLGRRHFDSDAQGWWSVPGQQ